MNISAVWSNEENAYLTHKHAQFNFKLNYGSITMTKSDVDEILVQLYLRLNGYFTSGFIVHSDDWGRARTEVDCIAVRHPHYREPERQIEPSEFLGANEGKIDLILCEVKHDPEKNKLQ